MGYRTEDAWATQHVAGKNVVRQLLVPAYDNVEVFKTELGPEVASTPYGQWPVTRTAELPTEGPLAARLPARRSKDSQITWVGGREAVQASDVIRSFEGAIGFTAHDQPHSLRRPQIAALHSIVGYQSSGLSEPGIVVMPTGTGKTETMLAWLVAQRPERVLVVVPSTALRDQIATKFETLGILQLEGIVDRSALRPRVGRLEGRFADDAEARAFVEAANVVVTTPNAIHANEPEVREVFFQGFTHLPR